MFTTYGGVGERDRKFTCLYDNGNYFWEQTAPDWREEASTTITNGLVGHWTFNEGQGTTAYDYSGNNNDGTLSNPNWPQGEGWAMDFDGTDDYVGTELTRSSIGTDATFTAWVYLTEDIGVYMPIFGIYNYTSGGWNFFIGKNTSNLTLGVEDGNYTSNTGLDLIVGEWQHVTYVREGTTGRTYLNGVPSSSTFTVSAPDEGPISIGWEQQNSTWRWKGNIDDARAYSRALSASEITDLYNGKEVSTEGLVGWWAMNEGENGTCTGGADVCDLSGNANHGTNNGATWLDGRGPTFEQVDKTQALEFDGVSDYVDAGNDGSLAINGDLTIGAWLYRTSTTRDTIVYKDYQKEYELFINDGNISLYQGDGDWEYDRSGSVNLDDFLNQWVYVLITRTTASKKLEYYVNGELIDTDIFTKDIISGTGSVHIGAARGGNQYFFNGQIDDVRIYNRALRPEEIRYLYETTYRD
jgi:hypothetical protein